MKNKTRNQINKNGFTVLRSFVDKKYCLNLKNKISKYRGNKFYASINEFKKKGRVKKNNPDLIFNYINNFDHSYIDKKILEAVPGRIVNKKIIWSVNKNFLPRWLRKYEKYIMGNLNHYIKEEFTNESHFYGTYIHSDILNGEKKNFITAYLYLDEVKINESPLIMFEKTHQLGGARWPVMISKIDKKKHLYINGDNTMFSKKIIMTGKGGDLTLFDGRTLHYTARNISKNSRVSLRYLIVPNKKLKKYNQKMRHLTFGIKGDHKKLLGLYNVN